MTTAAPTCDHQWMNRLSICLVCGKQGDVEVELRRHVDQGQVTAMGEDEIRRRFATGIESLRYMQQRYGVQPRRRARRWWFLSWVKPWGDHDTR